MQKENKSAAGIFDDYIEGRMSAVEKEAFETRVSEDQVLASALERHLRILAALDEHEKQAEYKKTLSEIHEKEFGQQGKMIALRREENFAAKHGKTIAVAASTALFAALATVVALSAGGYLLKKQSNQITDLNREVMELRASSNAIVEGITRGRKKKVEYAPANLEGSAFALNNKGHILTSFHMVNGADSIFVQNGGMQRTAASLVYSDPRLDLAILKIDADSLVKNWSVPFVLREREFDLGERVFTLGYPQKDVVYGEGALSSLSGYSNDTTMFQISIPVNPGNSGGPVLDDQGDVIGVIRGKISGAEATGFAVRASHIISSIHMNANDSTRALILNHKLKKPVLKALKRSSQIKKINDYVFNIMVYKPN